MYVVRGAAASSKTQTVRASLLTKALWTEMPAVRQTCSSLQDAIAILQGETVLQSWDESYDNEKDNWAAVLSFANYDQGQLLRAREALARCGYAGPASGRGDDS